MFRIKIIHQGQQNTDCRHTSQNLSQQLLTRYDAAAAEAKTQTSLHKPTRAVCLEPLGRVTQIKPNPQNA